MADFHEVHPHAGSLYKRVIDLFTEYVPHTSWTFNWASNSVDLLSSPFMQIVVTIVTDAETNTYYMALADTLLVSGYGHNQAHYIGNRPGFNDAGAMLEYNYGSRYTASEFATHIVPLRKELIIRGSGATFEAEWTRQANGTLNLSNTYTSMMMFDDTASPWIMISSIMWWDYGYLYVPYAGQPIGSVYPVGVPGVASGGGGTVDLTPVVDAINAVADQDTTYTSNFGGTTWSVRGKVRTGP